MKTRRLGSSGLSVSAIGLGCNPFGNEVDAQTAEIIVNTAIDAGITYFDTADTYGERGGSETRAAARLPQRVSACASSPSLSSHLSTHLSPIPFSRTSVVTVGHADSPRASRLSFCRILIVPVLLFRYPLSLSLIVRR